MLLGGIEYIMTGKEIKDKIHELVEAYYESEHKVSRLDDKKIKYSGRVYDSDEMNNLVDAALEFWLTSGRYTQEFEKGLSEFVGTKYCSLVNSGSSANLCAFMALTSPSLGERQIKKDDEVITVAAAFPTTVNPIIQYGAIPVFVDITLPNYNIDTDKLESAMSRKTKAVFLAHTLGNPFDIQVVKDFCDKYNLWLIEDNCDALGSKYLYNGRLVNTGTVGDLSTYSFYPPHHITLGEGGAVCTNNTLLYRLVNSFRDWGRDCWCASGVDDTCKNRYSQQFGELPYGYDHKYVYSHFGYNLKATDLQAAVGCAQLKKLEGFVSARKNNWKYLRNKLQDIDDYIILPEKSNGSDPSWFGFLLTVKTDAMFDRNQIVQYLEDNNIQTRLLFSGNYLKHPCFDEMRRERRGYKVIDELNNTDFVMNNSFWIGVYPGMDRASLDRMVDCIKEFIYKIQNRS